MSPETIHCRKCRKAIKTENFEDGMSKLRHHYKKFHPRVFKESIKKAVKTRKARK